MGEMSRSAVFRAYVKNKANKEQQEAQPTKPQKRVGDRPFTGMKEDKNKGEER